MNILVTGANGYIGKKILNSFSEKYNITTLTRQDCDLTNSCALNAWFKNKSFDVVIHTAACGGNRLIKETSDILDNNLIMYYNLLYHRNCFHKFINFGSGAEFYKKETPYGLSKAIIAESIKDKPNFYNIRIYAVFDEKEDSRRFIKSNIIRYKQNETLIIHQNKKMDFFYMKDLVNLVEHYINNDNLPKQIDCSYKETLMLSQVADLINNLDKHKCKIKIEYSDITEKYSGTHIPLIPYIGLEKGIKEVYKAI